MTESPFPYPAEAQRKRLEAYGIMRQDHDLRGLEPYYPPGTIGILTKDYYALRYCDFKPWGVFVYEFPTSPDDPVTAAAMVVLSVIQHGRDN